MYIYIYLNIRADIIALVSLRGFLGQERKVQSRYSHRNPRVITNLYVQSHFNEDIWNQIYKLMYDPVSINEMQAPTPPPPPHP